MSVVDERELRARVDAANESAHKCLRKHAIIGNNIYRDGVGNQSCLLCRILRQRVAPRAKAPSRRKPHVPLSADLVRSLRARAGIEPSDGVP